MQNIACFAKMLAIKICTLNTWKWLPMMKGPWGACVIIPLLHKLIYKSNKGEGLHGLLMSLNRRLKSKQTKNVFQSICPVCGTTCQRCLSVVSIPDATRRSYDSQRYLDVFCLLFCDGHPCSVFTVEAAWGLWAPSECFCPACRGIWHKKKHHGGWLSWFCSRKSLCEWSISVLLKMLKPSLPVI